MSSNSINFGPHNTNQICSNFVQVVSTDTGDSSYCAQKQDAGVEYLGRIRMVICSHVGSINFTDPANILQVHGTLMSEIRNEVTYISNNI